jgi:hypothetical protein
MKNITTVLLTLISFVFNCQDCTLQFDSQIKDIIETHDGNIAFISENSKITKVDLNFDTIWHNNALDSFSIAIKKIKSTFDGGFIGCGNNSGTYLFKMNSIGDTLWTKQCQLFGFGPFGGGSVIDIIQTSDSGYAFMVIYGHMSYNSMVVKTNSLGDTLWTHRNILSSPNIFDNQVKTISEASTGEIIVSGLINQFNPNLPYSYLYGISVNGDSLWSKTYDNFHFNSVTIDNNDNLIIASEVVDNSSVTESRIVKANSTGDTLWTKKVDVDLLNCVQLTSDGSYVFGGAKVSNTNFSNGYLHKTNSNGDSLWSRQYTDTAEREVKKIINSNNDGFLMFGANTNIFPYFNIDCRLDVDSLGYCESVSNIEQIDLYNSSILIYPNPTKNNVQININNYFGSVSVKLFDFTGKLLKSTTNTSLSLTDYPDGIYLLKVTYADHLEQFKLVKE